VSCVSFPSSFCRACCREHSRRWRRLRVLQLSRADLRRACVQQKLPRLRLGESILVPDHPPGHLGHLELGLDGELHIDRFRNEEPGRHNLAAAAGTETGRDSHRTEQLDAGHKPLEAGTHRVVGVEARCKENERAEGTGSVPEGKDFAVHIGHVRNPAEEAALRTDHEAAGNLHRSRLARPVGSNPGLT